MRMTEAQKRVLAFFRAYEQDNGSPPTLQECADFLGCSRENVRQHAAVLRKKGLMERGSGKERSWRSRI